MSQSITLVWSGVPRRAFPNVWAVGDLPTHAGSWKTLTHLAWCVGSLACGPWEALKALRSATSQRAEAIPHPSPKPGQQLFLTPQAAHLTADHPAPCTGHRSYHTSLQPTHLTASVCHLCPSVQAHLILPPSPGSLP